MLYEKGPSDARRETRSRVVQESSSGSLCCCIWQVFYCFKLLSGYFWWIRRNSLKWQKYLDEGRFYLFSTDYPAQFKLQKWLDSSNCRRTTAIPFLELVLQIQVIKVTFIHVSMKVTTSSTLYLYLINFLRNDMDLIAVRAGCTFTGFCADLNTYPSGPPWSV